MAKQQSYKMMMDELQAVLAEMQRDDLDVDEALAAYQHGQQLIGELEAYLRTAKNTITHQPLQADAAGE